MKHKVGSYPNETWFRNEYDMYGRGSTWASGYHQGWGYNKIVGKAIELAANKIQRNWRIRARAKIKPQMRYERKWIAQQYQRHKKRQFRST